MPARQPPPWLTQTLRQAAALASVPGLPADSILCVRRLQTRLDAQRLRHAGGLLATADQLSRLLQRHISEAARPARGNVSATTPAVLFDDPPQMLACAAHDWLDGRFAAQWWWRSLLDSGALARGAAVLWQRHPVHIPAALAALEARAGEFAGRLPTSDAENLITLLGRLHALPAARPVAPDWIPQLPDLPPDDPRQHFLTLGLLLAHAPGLVRFSARAPDAGVKSCEIASDSASPNALLANATAADPGLSPLPAKEARITPAQEIACASPRRKPGSRKRTPLQPGLRKEGRAARNDGVGFIESFAGLDEPAPNAETALASSAQRPAAETADILIKAVTKTMAKALAKTPEITPEPRRNKPTQAAPLVPSPIEPSTPTFARMSEQIETRYGGVLYLLNLALHLDFYADFTQPGSPGLALSPWHFLALAGERLAGRGLRRDALWPLLARLAGNNTVACNAAPPLPGALRPYVRNLLTSEPPDAAPPAPATWADWLDALLPPLRRRLAAALGVPARQVGGVLCRQPARIQVTPARLEVHFNLNDHPLPIRLAGLDRDPGWIPAAGRDVRFFYD